MEKLAQDLRTLVGIQLSTRQLAAFKKYEEVLLEWNQKYNLTAIRDEAQMIP
mgnify:CR=1 FL=1